MTLVLPDTDQQANNDDWFSGAPLGQLVFDRTYSRKRHAEDCEQSDCSCPKETWPEMCRRVAKGNCDFVDPEFIEPGEEEAVYQLILNRQMIPGGRHLWVTGVPDRAFTQNCHRAGFETGLAEHCGFTFSELMKGGGVGANYSSRYLEALAPLHDVAVRFICSPEHPDFLTLLPLLGKNELFDHPNAVVVEIEDSREGWVAALELLLEAAQLDTKYTLIFDVSKIRERGAPIRGFGGTASGPKPLIEMLGNVAALFPSPVTPQLAMEIDHLIATAVVAGNVRRSARMSVMHWRDPSIGWFLNCKADHLNHWSTNISVEIDNEFLFELMDPDSHASWVYREVLSGMLNDGEPGFYNAELASKGELVHLGSTNPCGEIPLESWESCNLGHVNLAYGTDELHEKSFRLMTRFLIRATFSDIQDPKQRAVVQRNRRIGVGFFGLQEWLGKRGIPYSEYYQHGILADSLTNWYGIVKDEARSYSRRLGIPNPIKLTTVAPTGTIAKLAGTSEAGQAIYAKYYIRRVRYAENDPEVAKLTARGVPFEKDIYTAGTVVASFPCEDPILTRVPEQIVEEQHEISIEAALGLQALIQRYYADNAISMTINVPSGCASMMTELDTALRKYLPHLKGVTVFPEKSRPQSPIEWITKDRYYELSAEIENGSMNSGESDILLEECVNGACPIR